MISAMEKEAYRMGQIHDLEKTSSMALVRTGLTAARGLLANRAGTAFSAAQKFAPRLIGQGTRGANIARTLGRDLISGPVVTSGLFNAGLTAYQGGDMGDIAKSYAVGSLGFGLGAKYLGLAGNRMASQFVRNPKSAQSLANSLMAKGVNRSQARLIGTYNNQAMTALKAGNLKNYQKYNELYKGLIGKTNVAKGNFITSPMRKLMFNAANNRANIGVGLSGTVGSLYLGSKLNDQLGEMAGVSGTQIAQKQMLKKQKEQAGNMQNQPMRINTLMYGNNPYSYG